ncbi:hypothetical protein [Candidatus Halobonum tyrrellensis]|uniref:Uncharacterized protein n=1 Tax=Candidatus Halobonum tyrrellensis G22 TaxID=1324957 RepID=V4HEJ0_9EURY|nr:hypothetical protein [Candidatus Halobonum tyrrellensis]ESP89125.1 hypothetical protein K933_05463 [Candidatus Halobonum tyrrellensis G22]
MTDDAEAGGADDAEGTERSADAEEPGPDTVPEVELGLYQVSVRVKGRADDDLTTVEETAVRLVDHLVERAETLEEAPDDRGLG